jgi:hypothetical protein
MGRRHGLDTALHRRPRTLINEERGGLCAIVVRATELGARQNSGTESSTSPQEE